jgi:hypothetical protein
MRWLIARATASQSSVTYSSALRLGAEGSATEILAGGFADLSALGVAGAPGRDEIIPNMAPK